MAKTVISAHLPPHIDVTRAPIAYGNRALPRLKRELQDIDLLVRQRAVRSLKDYLKDPEHVAAAISLEIPETLKPLLGEPDLTIRERATACYYAMAEYTIGRVAIVTYSIIPLVARLFDDQESLARLNAHKTIELLCEAPEGANAVLEAGLTPILVKKLHREESEIQELILDTLHFMMRIDPKPALATDALQVFTSFLFHQLPSMKAKGARNIADITVPLAGKEKAIELQALQPLISLLSEQAPDVKANAAGAIGSITITTPGKYAALDALVIPRLTELINDDSSEVRANVLKALTCLSEAPEGREELLKVVDLVRRLESDPIPAVAKAAQIAVKVITWKP